MFIFFENDGHQRTVVFPTSNSNKEGKRMTIIPILEGVIMERKDILQPYVSSLFVLPACG